MKALLLLPILLCTLFARAIPLQKPEIYTGDTNLSGWVMSEKLDGIRGCWDGRRLLTKNGNPIHTPDWFTQNFPPFPLDGELWSGRGAFAHVQSVVLDEKPSDDWRTIGYHLFEVPQAEGDFFARLEKAKQWFAKHPASHVHIIRQIPIENPGHMHLYLQRIVDQGGEGLILKDPTLPWFSGRSSHILKAKISPDMEGEVIAINPGKGKLQHKMGSLTLRLDDGTTFRLGTGFSMQQRRNPPKIGDRVTFRYHGFTRKGIPRFASFLRIRKRE